MTNLVKTINNISSMKSLLKVAREKKGYKTREVAQLLGIDQALISKFESGSRKPTREQVIKLSTLLDIDFETIIVAWLKEKIIFEIGQDDYAVKALRIALDELNSQPVIAKKPFSKEVNKLIAETDLLKTKLLSVGQFDNSTAIQSSELEFTFVSNYIDGSTMSLSETSSVIREGLTIPGKSMREHLEIINHQEAIAHIKELVLKNIQINERELLAVHKLIARGILTQEAGGYRKIQLVGNEATTLTSHVPDVAQQMENLFTWYDANRTSLHPIILAAEMHQQILQIDPFIEGTGKVARLIMNLILLQNGYQIANICSNEQMQQYKSALSKKHKDINKEDFYALITRILKDSMERNIGLSQK